MTTTLNIVAHPDDDLLFLNPDILTDLNSGIETHVLYLTAGDEGKGESFMSQRRAAVAKAYGGKGFYKLTHQSLRSNLAPQDCYGDLYRLWNEEALAIKSMYGTRWDKEDLLILLRLMIYTLKPSVIRTHDPDADPAIVHDGPTLDHLDHIYTAKFVQKAAENFPQYPVWAYMGYPIRFQIENVTPDLAAQKLEMWRRYQSIATSVAGEQWDVAKSRCYKRRLQ